MRAPVIYCGTPPGTMHIRKSVPLGGTHWTLLIVLHFATTMFTDQHLTFGWVYLTEEEGIFAFLFPAVKECRF